MTPTVKSHDARTLANQGGAWRIYLEYRGANWDNVSGRSSKFYEATGVGRSNIRVRYGKIGSNGTTITKYSFGEALEKVSEKLGKGYDYAGATGPIPKPTPKPTPVAVAMEGLYADIAKLVPNGNRFDAYDVDGDFLLSLSEKGAKLIREALVTA